MTLGIIDKLSSGRLTGGRIVAATGTIDQDGNVGDVGGVAQKTIAVERAGATVFFVPKVEFKTAESKATPQLHVYAVTNLDQVLRILKGLGGTVPTNPCRPRRRRRLLTMPDGRPPISSSRVATGDIARHSFAIVPPRLRPRRGAVLPAVGRPQHRGARSSASRSCGPPSPRPRSGRRTRWSTRPP